MRSGLCAAAVGAMAALSIASPSGAIVIGNADTNASDYISLATTPGFVGAGGLAYRSAYSSVGQIYGTDSSGAFAASGVLIAPNWVLTAAHVTSGASSLSFYMDNGGGFGSFASRSGVTADQAYTYSKWTGNLGAGYDIGLIHLSQTEGCVGTGACSVAQRYTGTHEIGGLAVEVGYGMTGTGATGATTFDGLKRAGSNMVDATYNTPGKDKRILLADFDSGAKSDNSYGAKNPTAMEAMIAPGDSGGGLFEGDLLVGITSFGWARLDGTTDSDFGDVGGWTRVSMFNSWIDSIIGGSSNALVAGLSGSSLDASFQSTAFVPAPEPGMLALFGFGLAGLTGLRRRRAS